MQQQSSVQGVTRLKRGVITMHVAPICRLATSRPFILGFGQQICCRTTSTRFSGGWRISRLLRASCGWYSDSGRPAAASGLNPGGEFHPGRLAGQMPETGPTGRCGYGLGPWLMDRAFCPRPVAAAALRQHSAAGDVTQQLVGTAWDAALGARDGGQSRRGPGFLSGGGDPPLLAAAMAGVYAQQSLEAAGDGDSQPGPSSGLFGEGTPVEVRVDAWRRAFGLADDEEFAYVFMSAEEAQRQAGAEIAAKWREVRERVDEGKALAFAHEAAQAGAAAAKPSTKPRPPLPRRRAAVPKAPLQARPPVERAALETPLVEELADLWVDANVQRPSGELNAGRQAEWENFVRRRAAKVCSEAEVATIKKAVVSLRELQHFQVARGRDGLEEVDTLDLDAFIFNSAAPHRAVAGLRWAAKQAELTWKIPDAPRTEQRRKPKDERQATLAEPPTLVHLEKVIEERCILGDPRWTAMLGQWMQASSCMPTFAGARSCASRGRPCMLSAIRASSAACGRVFTLPSRPLLLLDGT
ncbi:clpC [Symbiodinium sp. CCMP2592]|nr:clpC [Symbiodinium sp. CCMP2592]